jgi:uncharacterized protein YbjT (DUF2867 family)
MILITGATGNVGRPLVEALVQQGAHVRAVTRNPSPGLPAGVEIDPTGSLDGVTSLFLNSRALGKSMSYFVARACATGVRRIVALSAINADDDLDLQPSRYRGDLNKEAETLAVDSGLEWVSLRPTMFCSNALGMWADQIRLGDTVYGPYAQAPWAPIQERDIAAVAAHALLTDDLLSQKIVLTGPQSLTQAEMVATIGEAIGRNLQYHEIPPTVAVEGFVSRGFVPGFANALMSLLDASVGHPALVTDSVQAILGRPASTFAQWATDHKNEFQR